MVRYVKKKRSVVRSGSYQKAFVRSRSTFKRRGRFTRRKPFRALRVNRKRRYRKIPSRDKVKFVRFLNTTQITSDWLVNGTATAIMPKLFTFGGFWLPRPSGDLLKQGKFDDHQFHQHRHRPPSLARLCLFRH